MEKTDYPRSILGSGPFALGTANKAESPDADACFVCGGPVTECDCAGEGA